MNIKLNTIICLENRTNYWYGNDRVLEMFSKAYFGESKLEWYKGVKVLRTNGDDVKKVSAKLKELRIGVHIAQPILRESDIHKFNFVTRL